jgi:hypothetical protein
MLLPPTLTIAQIKAAKPRERPYKLADGRGLTLSPWPAGAGGG